MEPPRGKRHGQRQVSVKYFAYVGLATTLVETVLFSATAAVFNATEGKFLSDVFLRDSAR